MRPSIHACMSWADINLMSPQVPSNLITRVEQTIRILVSFFWQSFWLWSLFLSSKPNKNHVLFPSFYPHSDGWGWCFCGRSFTTNHCKEAGQHSHVEDEMNEFTRWWFQNVFISTPTWGKWSKLTNIFQMGWNHQLDSGLDIYIFFGGVTGVQERYQYNQYYQSHPDPIIQGWTSFWASTGNGISLIWAWFGPPEK